MIILKSEVEAAVKKQQELYDKGKQELKAALIEDIETRINKVLSEPHIQDYWWVNLRGSGTDPHGIWPEVEDEIKQRLQIAGYTFLKWENGVLFFS